MYKIILGVLLGVCVPLAIVSFELLPIEKEDAVPIIMPFIFAYIAFVAWMWLEHFFMEDVKHRGIWWCVLLFASVLGATVYFFYIIVPKEIEKRRCHINK